ncbi:hypothetical protein [Fundicoccus culcitae]|uniref:Uncharacterized protein n=1 Tax=Fundicoccus culcitae TaxID=2969821 RepID=A0ABY5P4P4_9LACT|nr:hypothetical protein [Fundicoccus culcitae]UUX33712.1 hypothetical protein NRE15_12520 [Fundicoccus culcitae]
MPVVVFTGKPPSAFAGRRFNGKTAKCVCRSSLENVVRQVEEMQGNV